MVIVNEFFFFAWKKGFFNEDNYSISFESVKLNCVWNFALL